jgi:uncharacterized protein YgfB (UPF0149 family)
MLQVTFAEMERVLEELDSTVPAAEAHGCLVGALCTTPHYPMERWLEEIIPDEDRRTDDDSQQALRLLYADTLNALRGENMDFELLLPGDEISLAARAGGLSQWCQGFLYGFGTGQALGGTPKPDDLPTNVNEILNDLTHIGRASVEIEGDVDNDSEEDAYAEVVEYVRVGVQLIHDELIPAQANRIPSGDEAGDIPLDTDDSQDADPSTLH